MHDNNIASKQKNRRFFILDSLSLKDSCRHREMNQILLVDEVQTSPAGANRLCFERADLGDNAIPFSTMSEARQGIRSPANSAQG